MKRLLRRLGLLKSGPDHGIDLDEQVWRDERVNEWIIRGAEHKHVGLYLFVDRTWSCLDGWAWAWSVHSPYQKDACAKGHASTMIEAMERATASAERCALEFRREFGGNE